MKILSIDWDYFFPRDEQYDWGHREAPFFITTLWQFRTATRTPDGKLMLDVHVPTVPKDFWKRVLTNKPVLTVAESHCEIWPIIDTLRMFGPVEVVNLDAHHDCGYTKFPKKTPDTFEIDCGSWGYWGRRTKRISSFNQHYPAWRQQHPEGGAGRRPTATSFELPAPGSYNAVFICRSGTWTPPWHDDQLQKLIKSSRLKTSGVLEERGFSLQQARESGEQEQKLRKMITTGVSSSEWTKYLQEAQVPGVR